MLDYNDTGLALDRAGQYQKAIEQFEIALPFCKKKKHCETIRTNITYAKEKLWNKQYEEKRKRREEELKRKETAAKQQVGKMLDDLGSSWGRGSGRAQNSGPVDLGFGPVKEKTTTRKTGRTGLTFRQPGQTRDTQAADFGSAGENQLPGDLTTNALERLRQENRGELTKREQPRDSGPTRRIKGLDKPKVDLLTTTYHGRKAAAYGSGTSAKQEAMKGFDLTGTKVAPLPTNIIDLRGRSVSELNEIPKDIGADIPTAKIQKVGAVLTQNSTWQKLKSDRQVIEQKQESIKAMRRELQSELSKPLMPVKRKEVLQIITKTYVEEKRVGDKLFENKMKQKALAEKVAKTVTIEIVDDDGSDASNDESGQPNKTEIPTDNNGVK